MASSPLGRTPPGRRWIGSSRARTSSLPSRGVWRPATVLACARRTSEAASIDFRLPSERSGRMNASPTSFCRAICVSRRGAQGIFSAALICVGQRNASSSHISRIRSRGFSHRERESGFCSPVYGQAPIASNALGTVDLLRSAAFTSFVKGITTSGEVMSKTRNGSRLYLDDRRLHAERAICISRASIS